MRRGVFSWRRKLKEAPQEKGVRRRTATAVKQLRGRNEVTPRRRKGRETEKDACLFAERCKTREAKAASTEPKGEGCETAMPRENRRG